MKRLVTLGVLLLVAAVAVQFAPHAGTAHAATANVAVSDSLKFIDGVSNTSTTTITAGDTVVWTWGGLAPHSVTADDGSFDEPPNGSKSSGTFSHQFNTPGTYTYYCRIHKLAGMTGTVVVQAAAAQPTSTNTAQATSTNTAQPTATGQATGTATGTATTTPTNATTGTTTPLASSTPLPSVSASPNTPAPAATTAQGTTSPAGGVAGAVVGATLPSTGDGSATGTDPLRPLGVLLAVSGFAVIGAGIVLKRRRL